MDSEPTHGCAQLTASASACTYLDAAVASGGVGRVDVKLIIFAL